MRRENFNIVDVKQYFQQKKKNTRKGKADIYLIYFIRWI